MARRGRSGGAADAGGGPGRLDPRPAGRVFTTGELTAEIKARVDGLGRLRVERKLSELRQAASGHLYFTLKDASARLSCAVWRSQVARALACEPREGLQVLAHGRIEVYAPRGTYSLIVERLEPLGIGALLAELEKLKQELKALGWFDRHRPLPRLPQRIGVAT